MKKTLLILILVLLSIFLLNLKVTKAEVVDVNCGGNCPEITPNDNWAGSQYLNPNPITISPATLSSAKNSYSSGDSVTLNWSIFSNNNGLGLLGYKGYEIRYSFNNGTDWSNRDQWDNYFRYGTVSKCLNPAPSGQAICLDNRHMLSYPEYLTDKIDRIDNNTNYIDYKVFDYRRYNFRIPTDWAGKSVKFQIIEKFFSGVAPTADYTKWYILAYSSTINVASGTTGGDNVVGDTTPTRLEMQNICSIDRGQKIYFNSYYLSQDVTSIGSYSYAEIHNPEANNHQYDSFFVDNSHIWTYWNYIPNNYYNGGQKIDAYTGTSGTTVLNPLYYNIKKYLFFDDLAYKISVNGGAFSDISNYISSDYSFDEGIPITSFQKNGHYTIHDGDTIQFQISRKAIYKKCLEPRNYGPQPTRRTTDNAGNGYCSRVYDQNGNTFGDIPIIDYSETQTTNSNKMTVKALPCMIKSVKVAPDSYTLQPNSQKSFTAEVEYTPFSLVIEKVVKTGDYSYKDELSDVTQDFYSTSMKRDITKETQYDSTWGLSNQKEPSYLTLNKVLAIIAAGNFDLSNYHVYGDYLSFEYKYLPEAYLLYPLSAFEKEDIFKNKFAMAQWDDSSDEYYKGRYDYSVSKEYGNSWDWSAAVGGSTDKSIGKGGDLFFHSIYNWPGSYHARALASLESKLSTVQSKYNPSIIYPSINLAAEPHEICKGQTSKVNWEITGFDASIFTMDSNLPITNDNSQKGEMTITPDSDIGYYINISGSDGGSTSYYVSIFVNNCAIGGLKIIGDINSGSGSVSNITVDPKSVVSASGNVDVNGSTWSIGSYSSSKTLNWDLFNQQMSIITIPRLIGEYGVLSTADKFLGGKLYINNTTSSPIDTLPQSYIDQYNVKPDGKVWVINNGDLVVNNSATVYGVGTIIIKNGNLIINQNINYGADGRNSLGFIVQKGNIEIGPNVTSLRGVYYAPNGKITFDPPLQNSTFIGDFIGQTIILPNPNDKSMIIQYDSNIIDNPPPGFNNLIAPNWGEKVP